MSRATAATDASASPAREGSWWPRLIRTHAGIVRIARGLVWPKFDLLVRLAIAQGFFVSGVLKVTNWDAALYLAAYEYPVSWMDPVLAAWLGAAIELVCPVLLAAGLLTRYAALPLLVLTLVEQFSYNALDAQLFTAALLGWYVVQGAGGISLDGLLRRGLADSALPLAPRLVRASGWVRRQLTPYYLALLRAWFGIALLLGGAHAGAFMGLPVQQLALWLPVSSASAWSVSLALAAGALLLPGFGTRYTGLALLLLAAGAAMMRSPFAEDQYLFWTLVVLVVQGGGTLSLDALLGRFARTRYPELDGKPAFALTGLPRVLIVGAGFGGLRCAAELRRVRVAVTLVDRDNYHLFQPLLYQVATAGLSPGDIAAPIRPLFRDAFNTQVLRGTVTGIDTSRQCVLLGAQELPYDFLVLATGAAHSYFGKDQWAPYAPGLKRIEDATAIRRRLLVAFERAEATEDDDERRRLLTFLIVGGGPTGVELAGAIAELARFGMEKEFRRFDPASARVLLVQSAPRVLPTFDPKLSAVAQRSLERLGVEVLLGSRVEDIDAEGVVVSGQRIEARTVLWAAGVMASPAATWLNAAADGSGRVKVGPDLGVPGLPNVFAIGDTALCLGWQGKPVPGLAPAAQQAGVYVARVIAARLAAAAAAPEPFAYRHRGNLATIGRKAAVAEFGRLRLWGAPAWWLWGLVHVGFLVGLRNRVATMTNWFWAYLTFGGGIRLITGEEGPPPPR
jgi:NADH dehydrogenase/putative oxidoreductase